MPAPKPPCVSSHKAPKTSELQLTSSCILCSSISPHQCFRESSPEDSPAHPTHTEQGLSHPNCVLKVCSNLALQRDPTTKTTSWGAEGVEADPAVTLSSIAGANLVARITREELQSRDKGTQPDWTAGPSRLMCAPLMEQVEHVWVPLGE